MYPVAVVLQYTKKHKITHTHTQNNTTHKITNTITQNYKHNAHKITNIMFQPNKEPKVEYNTVIQKKRNIQKNDTTVIKVTLS